MRRVPMLAVLLLAAAFAHALTFPPLSGRVVDAAGILSAQTRAELTRQLAAYDAATGRQIVVATIPSLDGTPIEQYGYQLGRHWGIGGKAHDTGVLLIVAKAEHKVRIEVGYGLEGDLTDAMSSNIINTRIVPEFRKGDYDAGVSAGVSAIIDVLGGQSREGNAQPAKNRVKGLHVSIFWLIVLFIVISGFGGRRGGGGGLGRAILWGSVLNGMGGGRGGGFGGGGFGGGGGFSGGGGSFGGGGASGSW